MMKSASGFAYIALLASLAILMMALTSASESIAQNAKREREQQLFFVGEQFRNAIGSYYENSSQATKQYPKTLESLLKDNRSINPDRHLRQIYNDPITDDVFWGLVKNEQQQIIGVFSTSSEEVLITNFDSKVVSVDIEQGILIYSNLKFIYTPEKGADTKKNPAKSVEDSGSFR